MQAFRSTYGPLLLVLLVQWPVAIAGDVHVGSHHERVLGTSLDIDLYLNPADTRQAEKAIEGALELIGELEDILSVFREDSEISRLNRLGSLTKTSEELRVVLQHCERWRRMAGGKFSCRLGQIRTLWEEAEKSKQIPDRVMLRKLARTLARVEFTVPEGSGPLKLPASVQIDADGLAKGYVIDQVFEYLRGQLPSASAIKVDIGGDGRYWGTPAGQEYWRVGVANPNRVSDNQDMLASLALKDAAVAASGHASRVRKIDYREFSHIVDPADGWPLYQAPSAIVIAADTVTADAVATALGTQAITAGMDWVNRLDGVEALLVSPLGFQRASKNWSKHVVTQGGSAGISFQLQLRYTIPKQGTGNYRRPYVAIWISDTEHRPVRNLLLLGESERWAQENTRWWRRIGRRNPELLDGVARPSRRPGEYTLFWDGRDDYGHKVPAGAYVLHLEAAREHGGHDYQSLPLSLAQKAFELEIEPSGELGEVKLSYHPTPTGP